MTSRRDFLWMIGASALAAPFLSFAQEAKVVRIGWLSNDRATGNSPFFQAFREGMRDAGYVEGRNLILEARFAAGSSERLDQLAAELVALNPQVIVTQGGPATIPVQRAGATMPVVFAFSGDPVVAKVVDSYARPGRNFTGVSLLSLELVGKRMEMLKEVMPALKRIAVVANPEHPGEQGELRASQAAAKTLGLTLEYFPVRNPSELDDALATIIKVRSEAIVVFPDAYTMTYSEQIAAFSRSRTAFRRFRVGRNSPTAAIC